MKRLIVSLYAFLFLAAIGACTPKVQPDPDKSRETSIVESDFVVPLVEVTQATPLDFVGEATDIRERGLYVIQPENGQLWKVGMVGEYLAWSPDGALMVFGDDGLRVMNLHDGHGLVIFQGSVRSAAWSPHGDEIAFAPGTTHPGSPDDLKGVYIIGKDGKRIRKLSGDATPYGIYWSPSGDSLALFTSPDTLQIHRLDKGESTTLPIKTTPNRFSWSPDGRSFATGMDEGLYLDNTDLGERRKISDLPAAGLVMWSPNLTSILTAQPISGLSRSLVVSLIDPVRGPRGWPVAITLGNPTWAPDGKRFAYISEGCTSGTFELHTVTESGLRKQLTRTAGVKLTPLWSPIGSQIIFSALDKLVLVDADTTSEKVLLERDAKLIDGLVPLGWSADGRYMAFTFSGGAGICD